MLSVQRLNSTLPLGFPTLLQVTSELGQRLIFGLTFAAINLDISNMSKVSTVSAAPQIICFWSKSMHVVGKSGALKDAQLIKIGEYTPFSSEPNVNLILGTGRH